MRLHNVLVGGRSWLDTNKPIYFYLFLFLFATGCHLKFHQEHLDKNEEFVGYCKGQFDQLQVEYYSSMWSGVGIKYERDEVIIFFVGVMLWIVFQGQVWTEECVTLINNSESMVQTEKKISCQKTEPNNIAIQGFVSLFWSCNSTLPLHRFPFGMTGEIVILLNGSNISDKAK